MADIFISYSKADRELALKLSAYLESEGWSVWWDKSLKPADTYRDEIMKQLAAARAVIVIWTENSIKSDWVRAEAGRAKADGKLIPVKAPGVNYSDIPLPFGEMHTENITSTDLIRAAVVAHLTKPDRQPDPLSLSLKVLRFQILTWIGIGGATLTLYSNLRNLFEMADWVRKMVTYWHDWTTRFWSFAFGWLGLTVPPRAVPLLSFAVFTLILVVGTRLRLVMERKKGGTAKPLESFIHYLARLTGWLASYLIGLYLLYSLLPKYDPSAETQLLLTRIALLLAWIAPYILLIYLSKERLQVAVTCALLVIFYIVLVYIPATTLNDEPLYFVRVVGWKAIILYFIPAISVMVIVSLLPAEYINRRLSFILIGTLALMALNKASTLELNQYFLKH